MDFLGVFVTDLVGRWRLSGSCRYVGFLDVSLELGGFFFRGVFESCWILKVFFVGSGFRELIVWRVELNVYLWGGSGWKYIFIFFLNL